MTLQACYETMGGNYQDVMRRFISEERIKRFLGMFLRDPSYALLCQTLEDGDCASAFRAVHTMKGVCMNLGLTALLETCVQLTENLREGVPNGDTDAYVQRVKETYQQTVTAIDSCLH